MKIFFVMGALAALLTASVAIADVGVGSQPTLAPVRPIEAIQSTTESGLAATAKPIVQTNDRNVQTSGCNACGNATTSCGCSACSSSACGDCLSGCQTSGCGCLQPRTSICRTDACGNCCYTDCSFGLSNLFGRLRGRGCGGGCGESSCGGCASTGCTSGCDSLSACGACDVSLSTCSSCSDCLRCCDGWVFVGETLFLTRTDADDQALIIDQNSGGTLVNARTFDFDYNVAPRLFLRRELSNCYGFEVGYLGLDSWNDTRQGGSNGVSPTLLGPGAFPFVSSAPGTVFAAAYGSEFHNAVVNARRRINECTTLVAGARMIDFSDTLVAGSTAPSVSEFYTIDADNHLYGFHIGFDSQVLNCGQTFHIDTILRAGLMFNSADQTTRVPALAGAPAGTVATNVGARDDHTAFVGELGVRSVYQLSNNVSLQGGYHLIWLEGVALAPDQIPVSSVIGSGSANLDTGGSLLFHGAAVGMTVQY